MKKAFMFSLGVLVALSSLFVSCADGGDDGGGNNDLFCNVSVTNTVGGSVSITDYLDNSSKVLIGADIEVVANPESGYEFIGWFIGNATTPVSTDAVYTFTVNEGVVLVAKFSKWPLVSISSGGNGTVSFENSAELSQYVQPGNEVTVVATPDADCDFLGWFIGNAETPISTDLTYTFTVDEGIAFVAKFSKWPLVSISSSRMAQFLLRILQNFHSIFRLVRK